MNWSRQAETLMYIGTFSAPFYFILPTSFGPYEVIMFGSAFCLLLSETEWRFPDQWILLSFFLILFGYTISIFNSVNQLEAIKFPLQFSFILLIQLPVIFTFTQTIGDFKNHLIALTGSLLVLIISFFVFLLVGLTTVTDWTSLFYNNPNTFGTMVLLVLVPVTFLAYDSLISRASFKKRPAHTVLAILIVISGLFTSLSSQSRRIFIGLLIFFPIIYLTSFLQDVSFKNIFRKIAYGVIVIIPLSGFIVFLDLLPNNLFWRIQGTLTGTHEGSGLDRRMWYNEVGLEVSLSQFPFGTGYNNYGYFSHGYVSPEELELISAPHNLIIEPFAEGGVIAGVGIMLLFGILFTRSARITFSNKQFTLLPGAFVIAAATHFAIHMVGTLIIFRMYWLIVILACVSVCIYGNFQEED